MSRPRITNESKVFEDYNVTNRKGFGKERGDNGKGKTKSWPISDLSLLWTTSLKFDQLLCDVPLFEQLFKELIRKRPVLEVIARPGTAKVKAYELFHVCHVSLSVLGDRSFIVSRRRVRNRKSPGGRDVGANSPL
jgi:hypothetical protein